MTTVPRTVICVKLKKQATGLESPPYPGELGERIYASISQAVWEEWLSYQTSLINEGRLDLREAKAQAYLQTKMEQFLFSDASVERPAGYVPPVEE